MTFRINLRSGIYIGLFILSLIALGILEWYEKRLQTQHQALTSQVIDLKELLQKAIKLDNQIAEQQKLLDEADQQGFYKPVSVRKIIADLNKLANNCALDEITTKLDSTKKTHEHLQYNAFTVAIRSRIDQDIFQFISQLEKQGFGIIMMREVNIFRNLQSDNSFGEGVSAELKFDIINFIQQ